MTIRAALIFNNHGKPRLTRFYTQLPAARQQALLSRIFTLVHQRTAASSNLCNFLDAPELTALLPSHQGPTSHQGSTAAAASAAASDSQLRVIYRHYATLYFVFVVDASESELGILDLIQVFVESLDRVFENVCELDLIFHFDVVHAILDEVIQGGLVLETNINEIVSQAQAVQRAKKASASAAGGASSSGKPGEAAASWTPPAGLGGSPWGEAAGVAANVGGWARRELGNRFGGR
ncbi:hypothetical protein FA10DRAFT_299534 [Acaromyces ingoldii]|uniref:AP complex mu/sigma subunit domain-containing protein n=1 Tax=Acaromyces ingoldii TaxID=215250 RepID=A0A316Z230_9BASI|nr:hypothetical protein FA10DRAFT_299534 [Acaromyces ingoldii]PWN94233.1 hypothetical protein FA10DRAFT_299534 [Acaromyces ingoldii]